MTACRMIAQIQKGKRSKLGCLGFRMGFSRKKNSLKRQIYQRKAIPDNARLLTEGL